MVLAVARQVRREGMASAPKAFAEGTPVPASPSHGNWLLVSNTAGSQSERGIECKFVTCVGVGRYTRCAARGVRHGDRDGGLAEHSTILLEAFGGRTPVIKVMLMVFPASGTMTKTSCRNKVFLNMLHSICDKACKEMLHFFPQPYRIVDELRRSWMWSRGKS
ncbi:hypothetical protein EVAR_93720_1 [Eumeta japonica]|uniref:Uncharacterized protein n=1 Tax=Eumeta variegata TaxID=151549 RepID=A0A4C1U456_EUMVA|nr:hypothetical protein EVAR_93720_1 [Eumeta japonica]